MFLAENTGEGIPPIQSGVWYSWFPWIIRLCKRCTDMCGCL